MQRNFGGWTQNPLNQQVLSACPFMVGPVTRGRWAATTPTDALAGFHRLLKGLMQRHDDATHHLREKQAPHELPASVAYAVGIASDKSKYNVCIS